jgi:signal transduction histidine kinase
LQYEQTIFIAFHFVGYPACADSTNYCERQFIMEKEEQLAATEAVLKVEEQERTRLAKDLHDGLGVCCRALNTHFRL